MKKLVWVVAALAIVVLVAACSGGKKGGGPGPSTLTVSGVVLDLHGGAAAGMKVRIGAASAVSASDGSFSIAGVHAPYDAEVVDPVQPSLTVFRGLTRADPSLFTFTGYSLRTTLVTGTMLGGSFPTSPGNQALVEFGIPSGTGQPVVPSFTNGVYTAGSAVWAGAPHETGKLMGFELTSTVRYGEVPVTLDAGVPIAQNVTLGSAMQLVTISGTISGIPSDTQAGQTVEETWIQSGSDVASFDSGFVSGSDLTAYSIPDPALTLRMNVRANSLSNGSLAEQLAGISSTATSVSFTLHPAPVLTSPSDGALGVSFSTPVRWSPTDFPAVYLVFLQFPMAPQEVVVTTALEATFVADSADGFAFPSSNYSWTVDAIGPYSSVDAATAGPLYPPAYHETQAHGRNFSSQ